MVCTCMHSTVLHHTGGVYCGKLSQIARKMNQLALLHKQLSKEFDWKDTLDPRCCNSTEVHITN